MLKVRKLQKGKLCKKKSVKSEAKEARKQEVDNLAVEAEEMPNFTLLAISIAFRSKFMKVKKTRKSLFERKDEIYRV